MAEPEKPVEKSQLETLFPEVDGPHLEAIVQLLYYTGDDLKHIESVDSTPYVTVYLAGEEWLILNDQEADEYAEDEVEKLIEESGTDAFSVEWPRFISNMDAFDTALALAIQTYTDGLKEELTNDPEFETRLEEEMALYGVGTEEELENRLANEWVPDGDNIQWYVNQNGQEEFATIADVDITALTNHIKETEGRGNLISTTDGEEHDLGKGFFAYKME